MGKVYIVGAGPGDPELITLKALKVIREADVVIYADSLVNPEILKYVKEGCEIYRSSAMSLEEIVDIMVRKAREGRIVVRLKSGDPSIYGALLEEISELEKAGIDYEIIPGVTAMTAAASVLKTSLTIPEKLQTIVIVRPSCRTPIRDDIAKLLQAARDVSTIAIYLGSSCIHNIIDLLIRAGYSKDTEVAIVYRATWRDQKTFICTLNNIENILKENNISGNYIVLIGPPIHTHTKTHQPRSLVYSVK
ncbi:MAG: precorrin-4 C(11)-methyltransferase [Ignisphaera sp.]